MVVQGITISVSKVPFAFFDLLTSLRHYQEIPSFYYSISFRRYGSSINNYKRQSHLPAAASVQFPHHALAVWVTVTLTFYIGERYGRLHTGIAFVC